MLGQPWALFIVFLINLFGTIYGYWWYKDQLAITPAHFYLFVPDSPTASLFFLFVLAMFFVRKNWPLMEAFAAVTLIKYGIWAVVMNMAAGVAGTSLNWQHYMLIFSHLGMAVQALLYAPYYRIKVWHLVVVAIWTLHNDVIDYVFGMHPWVAGSLHEFVPHIGYFTFWLSILSLTTVYLVAIRSKSVKIEL
ncbi:DUF1405 domain-containing protein [Desertibacillus haloalkaliphilus]|uniref:DUF1405 domain-containing protein n=1 Tax=Desertibacillus haloalkaliphilus TaxID=1328930 RepID=UPI001C270013|nr:DUF1405 domain-containing protein [Desertibacillus haloalkaliphilus]MBU8907265.1 DUF1405 domain-containing protein [Desertibacillus haloalkaliphilus]